MGANLLMAMGLMLVLEGIVPFAAPALWRDAFRRLIALRDGQLRFMGLMSMLIGLLLLWLAS